jgi:catechol 2,3-dioxygenase-like lactoylglutathione lyase family enzyme
MLDHVTIGVTELSRSLDFYARALAPLGISERVADEGFAGFGVVGRAFFWIGVRPTVTSGAHVAFVAADRAAVDAFYAAAIAAGGRDNGAPGLRPRYHADYYGAFVLDPDGHNIEAVCRLPAPPA